MIKNNFPHQKINVKEKILTTWTPKTALGEHVKGELLANRELTLESLLAQNCKILETEILELLGPDMNYEIASIDRVSHSVTSGKKYAFRVLVIGGNGKNIVTIGIGKDSVKKDAYMKAVKACKNQLTYIKPRLDHRISIKTGATSVTVVPLSPGAGVVASARGLNYCRLAGLTDVRIATGSDGKLTKGRVKAAHNYYRSLHEAVKNVNNNKN